MLTVALGSMAVGFTSCSDDEPALPGNGIEVAQWSEINDVPLAENTVIYEFDAPAKWTAAVEDAEWLHLLTKEGVEGKSSMRVTVDANDGRFGRTANVLIHVKGYAEPCVLTLRQGDGLLEKGDGRYRGANEEIYKYMAERYLWNEHIPELQLDYTIDYRKFLDMMLNDIAEFDNVNAEDGHWVDGKREYWYTNIVSNAPTSRTAGDTNTDSGLLVMPASIDTDDGEALGFAVMWCTPGSPADEHSIKRGHFITKVNNIAVTRENYRELGSRIMNGTCTLDVNDISFSDNGIATVTPLMSVYVSKFSYPDPSVYTTRILTLKSGKKVGYINHMGFHMDFDQQVIDAFGKFKEAGIDELIIDLRYNPGGHVLSSTVLGTLVAGQAHKGDIYVKTTYNASRMAEGVRTDYKIGVAENPEYVEGTGYDKIPAALSNSLGMSKVYVITTDNTASAAELVINGLRGLDINVNLVGLTSNGKNVGMEGYRFPYNKYEFMFYPITFYCQNAKGFKDYATGFKPDFEFDDSTRYPFDFGTEDDAYTYFTLKWIQDGVKPTYNQASRAAKGNFRPLPMTEEMKAPMTRRLGGNIQIPQI